MEGQNRVVFVIFAREQGLQTLLLERFAHDIHLGLRFLEERQILLLVGKLDQGDRVLILGNKRLVCLYLALERAGFLQDLLGLFHVVPKARLGCPQLELLDLGAHALHSERVGQVVYIRLESLQ